VTALDVTWGILAMGAVTWWLRGLPFFAERWLRDRPIVQRIASFLPAAVMAILVVHSVATGQHHSALWPLPEIACILLVVALQWIGKQALLSILVGTATYVLWMNPSLWLS